MREVQGRSPVVVAAALGFVVWRMDNSVTLHGPFEVVARYRRRRQLALHALQNDGLGHGSHELALRFNADNITGRGGLQRGQYLRREWTKGFNGVIGSSKHNECKLHRAEILLKLKIAVNCDKSSNSGSARASSAPFLMPAQPISGTVATSWPGNSRFSRRGRHSSRSTFIPKLRSFGPRLTRTA